MTGPTPVDPSGSLGWLDGLVHPAGPPAPPQASDPVVYRGAITIPRAEPPAVGGGAFRVDRERAPEAIRELEDAARTLEELRTDAMQLGRVVPPAADSVSRDAAIALSAVATGGSGSFIVALDAGIARLHELVRSLREDLADYGATDGGAAGQMAADLA